mmetsp:Transcript_18119/g.57901  ORF Transcript_18119/g.57901 Transcript_18119/m.57901 type:complete len:113 (+) Transcript_18119:195-533(+)
MADDHKLMFGFLFSLKQLVNKMAPRGSGGGLHACSTSTYKLHYFETASGLRFVLCTGLAAGDLRETLRRLYADIYVETLTKNPLHRLDEPITCKSFEQAVDAFFASLQQGQG